MLVNKKTIAMLLTVMMLVSSFATMAFAAETTKPEPFLKVLNPRPSRAPIDAVGLAPRLSTLENKTVAVIANYNGTMPPIAQRLADTVRGLKVIFISDMEVAAGQSPRPVEMDKPIINMSLRDFEADPSVADALVFGNGF